MLDKCEKESWEYEYNESYMDQKETQYGHPVNLWVLFADIYN